MSTYLEEQEKESPFSGANANYVEALYEQWLIQPDQVAEDWQKTFSEWQGSKEIRAKSHQDYLNQFTNYRPVPGKAPSAASEQDCSTAEKQSAVLRLINAYRFRGHQASDLDPLAQSPRQRPEDLDMAFHGLKTSDLDTQFNTGSLFSDNELPIKEIINLLEATYCRYIGYEYMHITSTEEKRWLQERIESKAGRFDYSVEQQKQLLKKLTAAEGLEKYLHTKYVGQKRFSLEGSDSLIPLLHELIQRNGTQGTEEIVLGMAHRGRLNVLVNILGKSPKQLFQEFEGKQASSDPNYSGDVKYHQGFSSDVITEGGPVHVALAFNPSHLEIINPVVAGSAKARQVRRKDTDFQQVMPVLIHGDSAFAGQGVVMELFNMSQARGFRVGGTLHIIVNNQIGFTTSNPLDIRSTLYTTEVAKMVQAPIFHVNGDHPEAVHFVMELASDFRRTFKKDVVIDMLSYRRHGHNEADEPAATQPMMYKAIRAHDTTRKLYGDQLIAAGRISQEEQENLVADYRQALDDGRTVAEVIAGPFVGKFAVDWSPYLKPGDTPPPANTAISNNSIDYIAQKLLTVPDEFKLHNRVQRIIKDRVKMAKGKLPMDWGFAETMAYGALLQEGFSVRLVGQDSGRGTFFHRHAVWHNQSQRDAYTPLKQLDSETHSFTVIDSLLSEEAVLGFEYGFSTAEPKTLVIWEAQFGDFANGAQVVIDQFISSGEAKWGRLCSLVMLLPHGYEGQGPEHSSARVERYMQLCAQYNMQVCMPTTPGQMFHMLRRQMVRDYRKPLIVFTPKSLLRHKSSVSPLNALADDQFQEILDDPHHPEHEKIERVVFCSGKVFFDLNDYRHQNNLDSIAIIRVEQLYPFPREAIAKMIERYPNLQELAWCQEEPRNQGAWYQIKHHFYACKPEHVIFWYAGRRRSSSPAVGSYAVHVEQQKQLISDALTLGTGTLLAAG